jgi:hypothetical protein
MFDGETKLGIEMTGPRPWRIGLDDDESAIDLLAPVHASGIFLAYEAAFGKADAIQLGGVTFEPEDITKLCLTFGDAEA